jgi:hypothetical protein
MRRLLILTTVVAAALSLAAPVAAATPRAAGDGHHEARPDTLRAPGVGAAKAHFAPLGARLSGAASVFGFLYDSNHFPTAGATVECDSWSAAEQKWYWNDDTTAADGYYSMGVLPTTFGEIWAYPDEDTTFALGNEVWANGASYSRTFYPGRVSVIGHRGGPWDDDADFEGLSVRLWGTYRFSKGFIYAGSTTASPVSGLVDALDGGYYGGSVKYFYNEGLEFWSPFTVSSGSTSGTTIVVDESDAQREWFASPYWYSGKPGASVKVALNNFPAGWINLVTGYTDDPDETASREYGTVTSTGTATKYVTVKVPSTATPGYGYWIGLQHVDGSGGEYPLYLEETYQICTMKASKTSVRKGATIRVTGVVPVEGHWGSEAGDSKVVTLYAHKGTARVPTKWNPASQGWVKVGTVRTNGYGAYTTPYFKPLKTLTLVVRYPGDDWYFGAYTSAQKITVR